MKTKLVNIKNGLSEFFSGLKYTFGPVRITTKPLNIFLRKRMLHKGYSLLSKPVGNSYEGCYVDNDAYTHMVYVDTLDQAKTYLKNEFGIDLEL